MDKQHQLMLIRGLKSGSLNKNQQLQAIIALKSNVDNDEVSNLITSLSFTNLNTGKDLKTLVDERTGRDRENFDSYEEMEFFPVAGNALVFDHRILHRVLPTSELKIIIRTDIIYEKVE